MMTLNNIPHLRVFKQKVYLPRDSKAPSLYNIVFINNKNIDNSINLMKHPMIITNSKYLTYYIDNLYKKKIHNKFININYRNRRKDIYAKIKDEFSLYKSYMTFDQVNNRNVYFDLHIYNELFFQNTGSLPILKRIDLYYDYLKVLINDTRFNSYKTKMVFIDVESWMNNTPDRINNPIMYLLLGYRKYFDSFKTLGDIDFYLYSDKGILRINPSLCDKNQISIFKRELNKIMGTINFENDEEIDKEISKEEIRSNISSNITDRFGFTGSPVYDPIADEVGDDIVTNLSDEDHPPIEDDNDEIKTTINKAISDTIINVEEPNLSEKEIENKVLKKLDEDKELLSVIHDTIREKKTGKSTASLQRDRELREKQKQIKLNDIKISDLMNVDPNEIKISSLDVSKKVPTTNEGATKVKFTNFEKTYNDTVMKKDTLNIITNLNDKSIPVYIKSIESEDTSDSLNYKETYHVILEDENRVRHSLTFDVPIFLEDKFLYLNGSKKIITKQLFMKPIVKTGPDEVQICSNYNKIFIYRQGANISPKIEKFNKIMTNSIPGVIVRNGDASKINTNYKTTLEYDELSKNYISIKTNKLEFIFDQNIIHERLRKPLTLDEMCIGFFNNNEPIIMKFADEKIDGIDFIDYIVMNLGDKAQSLYDETAISTKKFFYSRAKIMNKFVPLIILIGYCEGLTTVLRKANINHYFTDKRPKIDNNQSYIEFEDGYLVYDIYPLENSLLMNGLSVIPTKAFNYSDFDSKDIYLELFDAMYSARNLSNAFDSFYEFMIDPITKEILNDLDYPTDFVSVVIFANTLLADNSYIIENNMNLYRVRSNEIVNAIIHRKIADAYAAYRVTANSKNPTKISIPKDAIIKELMSVNTVEEFSTLNPIYETDKLRTISPKGVNGMNLEDAYTLDKRSYDPTMKGIIGISTSPKKYLYWVINTVMCYSNSLNCWKLLYGQSAAKTLI